MKRLLLLAAVILTLSGCVAYPVYDGYYDSYYGSHSYPYPYGYVAPSVSIGISSFHGYGFHHGGFYGGRSFNHGGFRGGWRR